MLVWFVACGPKIDVGSVPAEHWVEPVSVVVQERPDDSQVTVTAVARAGAGFDPIGQEGVASLVVQSIDDAMQVEGRFSVRVGLGYELVSFSLTCDATAGPACVDALAKAVTTPGFEADALAVRRAALVDQVEHPAVPLVAPVLHAWLFEGHRTGHPLRGRTGVLPTLGPDEAARFFARHYRRSTLAAGVTGPGASVLGEQLARALVAVPSGPPADDAWMRPPRPDARHLLILESAPEPQLALGATLALPVDHPDLLALQVAVAALSERLTRSLTTGEAPLAVDVDVKLAPDPPLVPVLTTRTPSFTVVVQASGPSTVAEALATTATEVDAWLAEGLYDPEFVRAREKVRSHYATPRSPDDALRHEVAAHITPVAFPDRAEALDALLRAQVDAALSRWLRPERIQFVVAGDPGDADALGVTSTTSRPAGDLFR